MCDYQTVKKYVNDKRNDKTKEIEKCITYYSSDEKKVLFLDTNYTGKDVQRNYRFLSLLFHPDKKTSIDDDIMKKISAAKEKLTEKDVKTRLNTRLGLGNYVYNDVSSETFLEKFNESTFKKNSESWEKIVDLRGYIDGQGNIDNFSKYILILDYIEQQSKAKIVSKFTEFIGTNKLHKKLSENNMGANIRNTSSINMSLLQGKVSHIDTINMLLELYNKYCTKGQCSPLKNTFINEAYSTTLFETKDDAFFKPIFNKLIANLLVSETYYTLMKFHDDKQGDLINKIQFNNYDNLDKCITEYKTFTEKRTNICKSTVIEHLKKNDIFKDMDDDYILGIYDENIGLNASPVIEHFNISDLENIVVKDNAVTPIFDKIKATIESIRKMLQHNNFTDNPIISDEQVITFLFKHSKSWEKPLGKTISGKKINYGVHGKIIDYRDKKCEEVIVDKFKKFVLESPLEIDIIKSYKDIFKKVEDDKKVINQKIIKSYHDSFDNSDRKHSPFLQDFINQEYSEQLFEVKEDAFFKPIFEKMTKNDGWMNKTKNFVVNHKGKFATAAVLGLGLLHTIDTGKINL